MSRTFPRGRNITFKSRLPPYKLPTFSHIELDDMWNLLLGEKKSEHVDRHKTQRTVPKFKV